MGAIIVLPYRDILVGILEHRPTVTVHVEIIGCGEDGDDGGKLFGRGFAMHRVSGCST